MATVRTKEEMDKWIGARNEALDAGADPDGLCGSCGGGTLRLGADDTYTCKEV